MTVNNTPKCEAATAAFLLPQPDNSNVCPICYQPECADSVSGIRPQPGTHASRLEPGGREYRGYCEWAVHPDEASFILHRGHAIVDGKRAKVTFIHNEAYVTQLRVENSDIVYVLDDKFNQTPTQQVPA